MSYLSVTCTNPKEIEAAQYLSNNDIYIDDFEKFYSFNKAIDWKLGLDGAAALWSTISSKKEMANE